MLNLISRRRGWLAGVAGVALSSACGNGGNGGAPGAGSGRSGATGPQRALPDEIKSVLDDATSLQILTVDPEFVRRAGADPSLFHRHAVLGKASVDSPDERKQIVELVYKGIADSDGDQAKCFNPRHAISAVGKGRTADLLICYECQSMEAYLDGAELGTVLTASSVESELTKIYQSKKLTIAPKG